MMKLWIDDILPGFVVNQLTTGETKENPLKFR
jgi:hypothetical protein